ncbi:MAG: transporter substrate-binding domain-containing protein [Comamonadaceae bacterium]|nr:transporter substrate-binding domain-containing protein [Comamonadaceae bacterium]
MSQVIQKMSVLFKWTTVLAFTAGTVFAHGQTVLQKTRTKNEIRIATTDTLKPWGFMDEANQPTGYNVDVSRELAKRLNIPKITFVADTYKNFISGLNSDRYDIVVAILTPTEERRKSADFSIPYMVTSKNLFVHADNDTIRGPEDMKGKRLAVAGGTSDEAWARKNLADSNIRVYDNFILAFQDLALKRVDARLTDRITGMTAAREGRFPVKIAGPNLDYEIGTIGWKKGEADMALAVNKVVQEMIDDGTLNRISRKWLPGIDMGDEIKKMPKDAK